MINFKKILDDSNDLHKALESESDRGLVMIIQDNLNSELEKIHINRIYDKTNEDKNLAQSLLQGSFSPLSTFAARTKIAYGYGLIDVHTYKALESQRNLRNKAAHSSRTFALARDNSISIYNFSQLLMHIPCESIEEPFKSGIENFQKQIEDRLLLTDEDVRKVFIFTAELLRIFFIIYNFSKLLKSAKKK